MSSSVALAKMKEIDEITQRIEALENKKLIDTCTDPKLLEIYQAIT